MVKPMINKGLKFLRGVLHNPNDEIVMSDLLPVFGTSPLVDGERYALAQHKLDGFLLMFTERATYNLQLDAWIFKTREQQRTRDDIWLLATNVAEAMAAVMERRNIRTGRNNDREEV